MIKKHKQQSLFTKALFIIGAITLGVMAWYSLPIFKSPDINWVGDTNGTVIFALSPPAKTITQNTETTLTLSIDTTTSRVTGAQVELMYDKSKLGTPVVTLGNFLPNVFVPVKITDSAISFAVATPPDSGGKMGTGTLATIKIKPKVVGSHTISYSEMIAAFAIGSQENMMKLASDATITVVSQEKPAKPTNLKSNCFDGGKKVTLRWDSVANVSSYKLRLDQKDGNNDKSIDNIDKTQYDLDILPNQKYSWWVHSTKDSVDSDEAKIETLECIVTTPTPTPTPSPTPKPTVKPTVKASPTPTTTPTTSPKASSTSTPSLQSSPPVAAGSLNDIFTDKDALNTPTKTKDVGFFKKVALGWQAILESLANLFR